MGKISLVLCLVAGFFFTPKQPAGDNMATLKAFIESINTKDETKLGAFIEKSFAKGKTENSVWVSRLMGLGQSAAPLAIEKVISEKPTAIVVGLSGKGGGRLEMRVDFRPDEPRLITGVRVGGPGSQSGPPPKSYTDWKTLDELCRNIRQDTKAPALAIAMIHEGKSESAVSGVRQSGKDDPALPTDRWLIGSITKSMTAMVIARLVDQGKLSWDTTLEKALPGLPMRDEYKKVTLLQLLRHRAGVPQDMTGNLAFVELAAGKEREPVSIREHYARYTLSREPIGKAGENMSYSNAGYALAGHIAEVVTKKPYEELLKELVFQPLGMSSAMAILPGSKGNPGSEGQLRGHIQGENGLVTYALSEPRMNSMFAPAGAGIAMTAQDLLKYANYHLDGLRGNVTLMSKKNFDTLHEPVGGEKYGCGWALTSNLTKEPFHGHNGSDGTFHAQMAIWPERNLAVVSIMNMGSSAEMPATVQAVKAVYDRNASMPSASSR